MAISKPNLKVVEFPVPAQQNPVLVDCKIPGSTRLTVVTVNNINSGAIIPKRLVKHSRSDQPILFGRGECLIGLSVTLALHLFWILPMPTAETREAIEPPKPIMVQWLGKPKPHAEPAKPLPLPKPHRPKKPAKPIIKPKVKPAKVATKPAKPLITASHKAAAPISTPVMTAPQKPPAVAESQARPVATAAVTKPGVAEPIPVTLPHLNADYLDNPAPDYPPASRELGEQGRVLVRAMVTAEGRVGQVALRKSSGFNRLDQAALDSVRHWRFVPARRGSQPVSAWVVVPVAFSIEG